MNEKFNWQREPLAEALVEKALGRAIALNSELKQLSEELPKKTSSRLLDWVDHIILEKSSDLEASGFTLIHGHPSYRIYRHLGAQLPLVVVKDQPELGVAIGVEKISDYLNVRGQFSTIEGTPFSSFRRSLISTENSISFWVVERREGFGIEPTYPEEGYIERYLEAYEAWSSRPRHLEEESYKFALKLAEKIVESVGDGIAASLVLEIERQYWQCRNRAAEVQKARQDRLGMGWGNHDHHTFRSSRDSFHKLVRLFETLGFLPRERFWAGKEAGWGAQVMEHPKVRLVLFLDVDLSDAEIAVDFAHNPLPHKDGLGTVGLWTALHGDSILSAGMHHLEAQFMFEELTNDLQKEGVKMMGPFSEFPYLKQAFTEGERWQVCPERLKKLEGIITKEEKERFEKEGAIGSHLENLQRREGYKGFNQKNVSFIIAKTDPRVS